MSQSVYLEHLNSKTKKSNTSPPPLTLLALRPLSLSSSPLRPSLTILPSYLLSCCSIHYYSLCLLPLPSLTSLSYLPLYFPILSTNTEI